MASVLFFIYAILNGVAPQKHQIRTVNKNLEWIRDKVDPGCFPECSFVGEVFSRVLFGFHANDAFEADLDQSLRNLNVGGCGREGEMVGDL